MRGDLILNEKVIAYRREFHRYAESGWREFRTTSRIVEVLQALGYEVKYGKRILHIPSVMGREEERDIDHQINRAIEQGGNPEIIKRMEKYTGALAILETGKPGPTIGIRFDIDANDGVERDDEAHRPQKQGFRSLNEGMMHACGHDGHAAMGLGLAEVLIKDREHLRGRIKLIFQPAEEGVRGAKAMVDKGLLKDVDYFFAGHVGFGLETGTLAPKTEGFLSTTKIDVEFTGKGAHAGKDPEKGKNSLLAAATAALNIHGISSHGDGVTRVNVGVMEAGVGRNVVPSKAILKIETRGETSELNAFVYEQAIKVIEGAAHMYDNQYSITTMGEAITAVCDDELAEIVEKVAKENQLMEVGSVLSSMYLGGSEDATLMMKEVQDQGGKATYLFFGSTTSAGHHNEGFDFDETVLMEGVNLYHAVIKKIQMIHLGFGD